MSVLENTEVQLWLHLLVIFYLGAVLLTACIWIECFIARLTRHSIPPGLSAGVGAMGLGWLISDIMVPRLLPFVPGQLQAELVVINALAIGALLNYGHFKFFRPTEKRYRNLIDFFSSRYLLPVLFLLSCLLFILTLGRNEIIRGLVRYLFDGMVLASYESKYPKWVEFLLSSIASACYDARSQMDDMPILPDGIQFTKYHLKPGKDIHARVEEASNRRKFLHNVSTKRDLDSHEAKEIGVAEAVCVNLHLHNLLFPKGLADKLNEVLKEYEERRQRDIQRAEEAEEKIKKTGDELIAKFKDESDDKRLTSDSIDLEKISEDALTSYRRNRKKYMESVLKDIVDKEDKPDKKESEGNQDG